MKKMKELLNKIMAKLGYFPRNKFGDLLEELVFESVRRDGEMLETEHFGFFIKVAAKDPYFKINKILSKPL